MYDFYLIFLQKMANYAQRKMYSVTMQESKPCVIAPHLDMCQKYYKFYDIIFTASSYVYRQACIYFNVDFRFRLKLNI